MVKINLKKASQIAVVAVCRIKSKTYRVTTTDEKQLISDQIAHLDKKIKTERDQNILTKLEEQRASCGLDLPMRTLGEKSS